MTTSRPILVAVLGAWLLMALGAGHAGLFEAVPGQPWASICAFSP